MNYHESFYLFKSKFGVNIFDAKTACVHLKHAKERC